LGQGFTFPKANCIVIYSLTRSADSYFSHEIEQLKTQINKQDMRFIDLNNWRKSPPHIEISGRIRQKIRQEYALPKGINQAVMLNHNGHVTKLYTGSVTLVNALIDCHQ
jgi:hypothetical protein